MKREQLIQSNVISDMAEGVMAVRFDGVIELVNDAALDILEKTGRELVGISFARAFFDGEENDAFIQVVLDAVYEKGRRRESYVPYRVGGGLKQLRIVSSCLREEEQMIGVILVISDITELTEMRDAVKAMERIQGLNRQLELRNRVLQETFGRYLSDDIVKEILEAPGGWKLGGQKRTLTVLMSDLRGFTAMSERMRPQDLIAMLNHYFGQMYEEIERYHGTLIEFLGDSLTVGEGCLGPQSADEWRTVWISVLGAFPALTAEAMHADMRVTALGGWGASRSWDNREENRIGRIYDQLCAPIPGGQIPADFPERRADAAVINLGTNDGSPILRMEGDERADAEETLFRRAAELMETVRARNPEAVILWAYGMCGKPMEPILKRAVDEFLAAGGERAAYLSLTPAPDHGSRSHPGPIAHRTAAREITDKLKEMLAE